jgi:DNA-binding IclR family transcriptional regulator
VAKELLRRVRREGAVEVLSPRPSPTELARLIGARRESVSREITRLVRTGVLRRTGEGLVVLDRRALIETATEAQPED